MEPSERHQPPFSVRPPGSEPWGWSVAADGQRRLRLTAWLSSRRNVSGRLDPWRRLLTGCVGLVAPASWTLVPVAADASAGVSAHQERGAPLAAEDAAGFWLHVDYAMGSASESEPSPLSAGAAGRIALGRLAEGLATLHGQGLVHGLVLPEFVAGTAEAPLLAGAGLLALLAREERAEFLRALGPRCEFAPELRADHELDSSVDIYGWASLLRGQLEPEILPAEFEPWLLSGLAESPAARPTELRFFARGLLQHCVGAADVATVTPDTSPLPSVESASLLDTDASASESAVAPAPPVAWPGVVTPNQPKTPGERAIFAAALALFGLAGLGVVGGLGAAAYGLRKSHHASSAAPPVATAAATPRVTPPSLRGTTPPLTAPSPSPSAESESESGESGESDESGAPSAGTPDASPQTESAEPQRDLPPLVSRIDTRAPFPSERSAVLPLWPGDHVLGDSRAQLTLLIYADLDCLATRRQLEILLELARDPTERLRIVWRHRPLELHPNSRKLAELAEVVAERQGEAAFWRFVARAAEEATRPSSLVADEWLAYAVPNATIPKDATPSAAALRRLERDHREALLLGIRTTPTLFLDGQRLEGRVDQDGLVSAFDTERLQVLERLTEGGTRATIYAERVQTNLLGFRTR